MRFQLEWSISSSFEDGISVINDLFGFELCEKETEIPQARLCIKATDMNSQIKHVRLKALDDQTDNILFQGRVLGIQTQKNSLFADIQCVAFNEHVAEKLAKIREELIAVGHYDPLLLKAEDDGYPALKDLLAFQSKLPYISRDLRTVALSSMVGDGEISHLSSGVYADSFEIQGTPSSLSQKSICLTATWMESYYGTTDISNAICERLPNKCIETFTGKAFEGQWWQADSSFGSHGYRVASSHLRYVGKGRSLTLDTPAEDNQTDSQDDHKGDTNNKLYTVCFKPQLALTWRYRQPRKEVVYFGDPLAVNQIKLTVKGLRKVFQKRHWSSDFYFQKGDYVETAGVIYRCVQSHRSQLVFSKDAAKWQTVCDEKDFDFGFVGSSFFHSERGQNLLEKVGKIVTAQRNCSEKASRLSFSCSGYQGMLWSVNQEVRLQVPHLKTPEVCGKISEMKLIADGLTGCFRCFVRLSFREVSDESTQDNRELIKLTNLDLDVPQTQHDAPKLFTARELLKDLTLFDGADEQEVYIRQGEEAAIPGTRLQLKLEDLSEKQTIIKRYLGEIESC